MPRTEAQRQRNREAARAAYWADPVKSRELMREKTAKARAERLAWINDYKTSRGCIDCGFNAHPAALHFDHVDRSTKTWKVSRSLTCSVRRLEEEIAKCVIRCANCHAIRSVRDGHLGRPRIDRPRIDEGT